MSENLFSIEAPKYWNAGIPVFPLLPRQKRPAIMGWQKYADELPTDEDKAAWLHSYRTGNVGVPLGTASGLVAIDIDTDDPAALRILDKVLPPSPWKRVGKKGMVLMYRFSGEKTTRIQTATSMICEVLSKGTQVVLPPSIHPDTGLPYTANLPLYEVLDRLPMLPPGIEQILREELVAGGVDVGLNHGNKAIDYVPAGQRDNRMVWHAGLLARAVTRGERTLLEVMGEMRTWVETYVERVSGDDLSADKAQKKIVEFLVRDVTGVRQLALPPGWDAGLTDEDRARLGLAFSDEDELWSAKKILDFLAAEIQRSADPGDDIRVNAINIALAKVARSNGKLTVLDEERVIKFIHAQSGGMVTMSALRKQLTELKKGGLQGENHDEIALEVIKLLNEFGEMRFHAGNFWQWRGSHWDKKPENEIISVISNEFGHFPVCKKTSDYHGVLKLIKSLATKDLSQTRLRGVNFANGFLTSDLDLLPHSPDFGLTYVLPYRYVPERADRMPMFQKFLFESWGNDGDFKEKVDALQEAMGATLFRVAPQYQRAFCLYGQAGSGKSVTSQLVRCLLPPNSISAVPPEDWADHYLKAELYGKVLNFAGELSETRKIPSQAFKQIVEGERTNAQFKYQSPFEFNPECSQWFNSNHIPKTNDTSDGFNRRWLFLRWNYLVPVEKRIPNLASIIADAEREEIAAWAVLGYQRLREQGDYTQPSSHLALVDQMASDNNSVRQFLRHCPQIKVGAKQTRQKVRANDLFNEYWMFCLASGIAKRVQSSSFIRMMRDLGNTFDFETSNDLNTQGATEVVFQNIEIIGSNA